MAEPPMYLFGDFHLDVRRRLLLAHSGTPVELTPRVLETLIALVRNPGVLQSREQLMDSVWPDASVEPNNLNQNVAKLRRALGERPGENRFIETVPGRGYRFIAPVRTASAAQDPGDRSRLRDAEADLLLRQAIRLLQRPTPDDCRIATEHLEKVLDREPDSAMAWAWLADARLLAFNAGIAGAEVLDTIERHARRALELEPRTGIAHTIIGTVRAHRRDWLASESHFQSALTLNPTDAMALTLHASFLLLQVGHTRRALAQLRKAFAVAPDDPRMLMNMAMAHCIAGEDAEASRCASLAVGFGYPEHASPLPLVHVYAASRAARAAEAATHAERALGASRPATGTTDIVLQALGDQQPRERALAAIDEIVDRSPALLAQGPGVITLLLGWLTQLGSLERAFALAHRAVDAADTSGRPTSWQALWSPELTAFRRDERFRTLAARLRFRDYWNEIGEADA